HLQRLAAAIGEPNLDATTRQPAGEGGAQPAGSAADESGLVIHGEPCAEHVGSDEDHPSGITCPITVPRFLVPHARRLPHPAGAVPNGLFPLFLPRCRAGDPGTYHLRGLTWSRSGKREHSSPCRR